MIVVVFRVQLKPQANPEELGALNKKMAGLVGEMPGFLGLKEFSAEDGEVLIIAEFDSLESVDAWKTHPEHFDAQRRVREEFFARYQIQVCSLVRTAHFPTGTETVSQ